MTVAMFKPYGLFHSIVEIFCSYHTQYRHHQFFCNQRMFLWSFKCNATNIIRNFYTNHGKKCLGITAYTLTIQTSASQNYCCQGILLFFGCQITSLFRYHIVHQLIHYGRNCYDFFFCNTRKIVIESTSVYNILCCFSDICCFINQSRRITCTCADSSLSG